MCGLCIGQGSTCSADLVSHLLSSLWDLRSCWFIHNVCMSGLAVCSSSRAAAQNTPAACDHLTRGTTLGHLPPTCCSLFGFYASIALSSSTLAYVFVCSLGPINNACDVPVHSLAVLVTLPVKNTSELMALFVQTFPGQILSAQPASRYLQSYVSLAVVEQR